MAPSRGRPPRRPRALRRPPPFRASGTDGRPGGSFVAAAASVLATALTLGGLGAEAAVPTQPARVPSFTDRDVDEGEIGGVVEFAKALIEDDITYYALYFGDSETTALSLLANLPVGGTTKVNLGMNFPLPAGATHFIVYSANADGIAWDLGEFCELHDSATPVQPPSGVSFFDLDLNRSSISGVVTIQRAADESDVTHYSLYFGSSPTALMQQLPGGLVPKAAAPLALVLDPGTLVPSGATWLLAYTWNDDGNSRTSASTSLHDRYLPLEPATSVAFEDEDLTGGEVSGVVTIGVAADEDDISEYAVYFAGGPGGQGPPTYFAGAGPKTGDPSGEVHVEVLADTPLASGATHVLVRTRSPDGEMATGISMPIVDLAVPVHAASSAEFDDTDIDRGQLGGIVTIYRAVDESDITYYSIFYGDTSLIKIGSAIASLAQGPTQLTHSIPAETPLPTGTEYLMVLAGNDDGVAIPANGRIIPLVDHAVPLNPPIGGEFIDEDTDPGELGGTVTAQRALDETDLDSYTCYFGTSSNATAANRYSTLPLAVVLTSGLMTGYVVFPIGAHKAIPTGVTHFLVFSRNPDGEIRTGVSVEIVDRTGDFPTTMASALHFVDIDVDMDEIGGPLIWYEPANTAGLLQYNVYKALDEHGTLRSSLGDVPAGETTFDIPTNTTLVAPLGMHFDYLLVYTQNSYGEALLGAELLIVDRALPRALALDLAFVDEDSLLGFVGGEVTWTTPTNLDSPERFTGFVVYFADFNDGGAQSLQLGTVLVSNSSLDVSLSVALGISLANFTHIQIFAVNEVGEALSGAEIPLVDLWLPPDAVEKVTFWDQDLGLGELGGDVAWLEPPSTDMIEFYRIYLVESLADVSVERLLVGEVPVGSTSVPVPFNTRLENFTEVVVVAVNTVGESLVFANATIVDNLPDSCPSVFGHARASSRWRVVAGPVASAWRVRAVRFFSDAACESKLPAVPRGWPRRPRQLEGRPFAGPPSSKNLYEVFMEQARPPLWRNGAIVDPSSEELASAGPWWSTGGPCQDVLNHSSSGAVEFDPDQSGCFIGFIWETDTFTKDGRILGSSQILVESKKKVHCVEVEQSIQPGEFAEYLALQYYSDELRQYRTLLQRRTAAGGLLRMDYQRVLAAECSQLSAGGAR